MSWSLKSVGPRAAVKAAVLAQLYMPILLKEAIVAILDEPGNGGYRYKDGKAESIPHDSARVEGHGHSGGGSGNIGKLEVELFTAAALPEPAPVVVTAPVAVVDAGSGSTTEKFADQGEPGPGV